MSDVDWWEVCPICKYHQIVKGTIDLTFHRMTDRGRVTCCVALPHGICQNCGFKMLDDGAEAIMDESVRQAYDRLPPASGKGNGA